MGEEEEEEDEALTRSPRTAASSYHAVLNQCVYLLPAARYVVPPSRLAGAVTAVRQRCLLLQLYALIELHAPHAQCTRDVWVQKHLLETAPANYKEPHN